MKEFNLVLIVDRFPLTYFLKTSTMTKYEFINVIFLKQIEGSFCREKGRYLLSPVMFLYVNKRLLC